MEELARNFTIPLLDWFDRHGRKNLPWQHPRDAYPIWISEIMLQQTQVKTVIPYFIRFMEKFPTIVDLAEAPEDAVLAQWSGLGYYSRARNLAKTAKLICQNYQGEFPQELNVLKSLPGIGASTAAAIASLAFNHPTAILDGNVKRVLCRYFMFEGNIASQAFQKKLWLLAQQCMSQARPASYTQAIMDLGATCCTLKNPQCISCPLEKTCLAKINDKIAAYPQKKLKKILSVKEEQFLLLHKDDRIYLEKNPPVGIWGGLWCLPSLAIDACPIKFIKEHYDFEGKQPQFLKEIKHSFSHFHLHIKAQQIETSACGLSIKEEKGRWFKPEELASLGLAKPVSNLISYFLANNGVNN